MPRRRACRRATISPGIRKALGARRADILLQFLIEAVVLCLVGGLAGIGLGVVFGVCPARRAAGLGPNESLRYE